MNGAVTRTKGAALLRAFFRQHPGVSQAQFAAWVEVKQPTVSAWLRETTRPEGYRRTAIKLVAAIPPTSWDTPEERAVLVRVRRRVRRAHGSLAA